MIEIVAIGNEVLSGLTLNTNAAFLAQHLFQRGWEIQRHTTLPDDPPLLREGLRECLRRADIVIATGGLGPTLDDLTRSCAQELFSTLPREIPNHLGTAPGLIYSSNHRQLILLPGVPQEMEAMFEKEILPYLQQFFPPHQGVVDEVLHFSLLKELEVDPHLRELQLLYPTLKIGIYPAYGTLTVRLTGPDRKQVEQAKHHLLQLFHPYFFPSKRGKIEEDIQEWFICHKKTLVLAESCTGGAMAARLTQIPGASRYFLGSFVTYANSLKELLQVSQETLRIEGAVSRAAVIEMARGLFEQTEADYSLAVSGIAGPSGGSLEKPVGTIFYALGKRGEELEVGTFVATGNREIITLLTVNRLFGYLWRKLLPSR